MTVQPCSPRVSRERTRGEIGQSLTWLRTEAPDYWTRREALATILRYLAGLHIEHWREDAEAARLVAGAAENDHI